MAEAGRDEIAGLVLPAWDAFVAQVEVTDLDRRTRLPGWRVQEVAVHLGVWPEHAALADLIASARAGAPAPRPDVDAVNARVTAAHRDASRDEVLAALHRNRAATVDYLEHADAALDTAPTVSTVGTPAAAVGRARPGLRAGGARAGPDRGAGRRRSPPGCSPPGWRPSPTSPARSPRRAASPAGRR